MKTEQHCELGFHQPYSKSFFFHFLEVKGAGCKAEHPNFPFIRLLGPMFSPAHASAEMCMQSLLLFFSHLRLYPASFCTFVDRIYAGSRYCIAGVMTIPKQSCSEFCFSICILLLIYCHVGCRRFSVNQVWAAQTVPDDVCSQFPGLAFDRLCLGHPLSPHWKNLVFNVHFCNVLVNRLVTK